MSNVQDIIVNGTIAERLEHMASDKVPPELFWPLRLFSQKVQAWLKNDDEEELLRVLQSGACHFEHLETVLRENVPSSVLAVILVTYGESDQVARICKKVAQHSNMTDGLLPTLYQLSPEALLEYSRLPLVWITTLMEKGIIEEDGSRNRCLLRLKNFPESVYQARVESNIMDARLRAERGQTPELSRYTNLEYLHEVSNVQFLRHVWDSVGRHTRKWMLSLEKLPKDLLLLYQDEHIYFSDWSPREEWHYNIASNPKCPKVILKRIWEAAKFSRHSLSTLVQLASNPATPKALLKDLSFQKGVHIPFQDRVKFYVAVCRNPNTPQEALETLLWIAAETQGWDLVKACRERLGSVGVVSPQIRDMFQFATQDLQPHRSRFENY